MTVGPGARPPAPTSEGFVRRPGLLAAAAMIGAVVARLADHRPGRSRRHRRILWLLSCGRAWSRSSTSHSSPSSSATPSWVGAWPTSASRRCSWARWSSAWGCWRSSCRCRRRAGTRSTWPSPCSWAGASSGPCRTSATYGIDALRDGVAYGYAVFAVAVSLTVRRRHIAPLLPLYRAWIPVFVSCGCRSRPSRPRRVRAEPARGPRLGCADLRVQGRRHGRPSRRHRGVHAAGPWRPRDVRPADALDLAGLARRRRRSPARSTGAAWSRPR